MAVRSVFDNQYYTKPEQAISRDSRYNVPSPQAPEQLPTDQQGGNPQAGGGNWMGAVSAIGQGISAGAGGEDGRFSIDPNAGFTGSFQGLGSGGVVGAIAGGITSQLGTFSRVNKNLKALRTGFDGYDVDSYGDVNYNSQAFVDAQRTADELKEGQSKINRSIDPATRVFSGIMGTKRKLREAQRDQEASIQTQRNNFNRANIQSSYGKLNRRGYEDQLKNVYGIPMGYY